MRTLVFVWLVALGHVSTWAAPVLTGQVVDPGLQPVKNATVFIYTAGPKVGTGSICPSCYPDCRKKALTDGQGKFQIAALDPKLIFRLLVVAPGMQPKFITKVDPAKGPQEIELAAIENEPGRTKIQGIVISPAGQPVFGAVLNIEGLERGASTRWGGIDRDADPVAVTDARGLFQLRCAPDVGALHALLETPGYAKRWVRLVPGSDAILRVQDGVIVKGQVLDPGARLVHGGVVAMATVEREAGKHLHDFEAITDVNGNFTILNVTPEKDYYLFGKMGTFGPSGSFGVLTVKAGESESTVNVGTIRLSQALHLKGRVVLSDGGRIPPNTRLLIGREQAWDYGETTLNNDGSFEFSGLPAEPITLNIRIKGYKLSRKNPSLDWLNGSLIGRMDKSQDDFTILLEPGTWRYNEEENDAPSGAERQPRDLPLRSAKL